VSGDAARSAGIHYLQNTTLDLTTAIGKTWRIHGSPGAPVYSQGAFQYDTDAEARGSSVRRLFFFSLTGILQEYTPACRPTSRSC
jgi:hypothetical protein